METESNTCSKLAKDGITCKHEHNSGPLPPILNQVQVCCQFKTIMFEEFSVSIKKRADSVVLIGNEICQVQNIITIGAQSHVVYKKYMSSSSFFQYPVESTKIGIIYVKNLGTTMHSNSQQNCTSSFQNGICCSPFKSQEKLHVDLQVGILLLYIYFLFFIPDS